MATMPSDRRRGALLAVFMAHCLGGCAADHFAAGLLPLDPPLLAFGAHQVDSLQPTLRWEAFPGRTAGSDSTLRLGRATNVTYELAIWRQQLNWKPGEPVIEWDKPAFVKALTSPEYRVEKPLAPGTTYRWTVRAHFVLDGVSRTSEWSGWYPAGLPRTPGRRHPHLFKTPSVRRRLSRLPRRTCASCVDQGRSAAPPRHRYRSADRAWRSTA